jgi:hypothetical protein
MDSFHFFHFTVTPAELCSEWPFQNETPRNEMKREKPGDRKLPGLFIRWSRQRSHAHRGSRSAGRSQCMGCLLIDGQTIPHLIEGRIL